MTPDEIRRDIELVAFVVVNNGTLSPTIVSKAGEAVQRLAKELLEPEK